MKQAVLPAVVTCAIMAAAAVAHPGHGAAAGAPVKLSLASRVDIAVRGEYRFIQCNGIPEHKVGHFPNRGNPNAIAEQRYQFRVPLHPKQAARVTPVGMNLFGVALNGVPFDPGAAEFWRRGRRSGWQYEALSGKINLGLDGNNAHVQPGGAYHYHGLPTGLLDKAATKQQMRLIGYAADGFPIYARYGHAQAEDGASRLKLMRSSYRLKEGARPSGPRGKHDGTFVQDYEYAVGSGDLDQCNGRFGATPEYPDGSYHYFVTAEFPFIPRYYRGQPDRSFQKGPPRRGGPPGRRPPPPRFP